MLKELTIWWAYEGRPRAAGWGQESASGTTEAGGGVSSQGFAEEEGFDMALGER